MNETDVIPVSQASSEPVFTLLFVDDEADILSALKRLFKPFGYHILTAESAAQGLEIMARVAVDLVVCDMRMPEMNGAQFLEKVRGKWPETVRILLTGYADIGTTIDAINKGEIYRYISKPWEDNDIALVIKHALQQKVLEREKLRLEELTQRQNEELRQSNELRRAEIAQKLARLTPREREVLDMLVAGKANKRIAYLLGISPRTIEHHRATIMDKMQADSLPDLVRMVLYLSG